MHAEQDRTLQPYLYSVCCAESPQFNYIDLHNFPKADSVKNICDYF